MLSYQDKSIGVSLVMTPYLHQWSMELSQNWPIETQTGNMTGCLQSSLKAHKSGMKRVWALMSTVGGCVMTNDNSIIAIIVCNVQGCAEKLPITQLTTDTEKLTSASTSIQLLFFYASIHFLFQKINFILLDSRLRFFDNMISKWSTWKDLSYRLEKTHKKH